MVPVVLAEAWPGGRRQWGSPAQIHLVEWAPTATTGTAVCGNRIEFSQIFPAGSADKVRVLVCVKCRHAIVDRHPIATVTQLAPRSARAFSGPRPRSSGTAS